MKTNKSKIIIVGLSFIFSLIISYHFAFKKTLTMYKKSQLIEISLNDSKELLGRKLLLTQKQDKYKKMFNSSDISNNYQNQLLNILTILTAKNNIIIKDFKLPHIYKEQKISIHTSEFKIQGDYKSISKLIYSLEEEYNLGNIISISYYKTLNPKSEKPTLFANVLLQSIH